MPDRKRKSRQIAFIYSDSLDGYLTEKLEIEKIKSKKKEGLKLSVWDNRRIRNNDDKKVRTLQNHLFRSMANLIHFFEFVDKHSNELSKLEKKSKSFKGIFDDDVEELLGFKGTRKVKNLAEEEFMESIPENEFEDFVFSRLIYAILKYPNPNIRLRLLKQITLFTVIFIRQVVYEKNMGASPLSNLANEDLNRIMLWAEYCAGDVKKNPNEPRRKIGF